jgi:crotonobetainyl-CoA:carnitine CoA-transferase CaiB-like acyl-CoA transferase
LRVGYPVCDSVGGLAAAFAVTSALVRRQRTGQGAFLDVSMLDAAISSMGWVVSDCLIAGQEPVAMGNENRTSAPSGTFDTRDGKLNIAANKQEQFETLCQTLGRGELLRDPRFVTRDDRKQHRDELRAELEKTLKSRSAADWDRILLASGVPAAPVASVAQALESEQVAHRRLVSTVAFPAAEGGELRLAGLPAHVDGAPVPPPDPPPLLGQHTDELLAELGYTAADITRLREEGAV